MALLEVCNLTVHFAVRRGAFGARRVLRAVDGVSFTLNPGETLGLVGESGCGKSTLARSLIQLTPVTAGRVLFEGEDMSRPGRRRLQALRRGVQMVFQDPYGSLNPRLTACDMLAEVLRIHTSLPQRERRGRVAELLELVGLKPEHMQRFPHEFSGGQRQRLGIARALAVEPRLILADEPVSALDVSVQAQIINLFEELRERLGLAYLFIAHDLAVVEHISHWIAVMYLGRFVEYGQAESVCTGPRHPYTQALFAAIPTTELGSGRKRLILSGEIPSPISPPPGCPFHPRCPRALAQCAVESPELTCSPDASDHRTACFLAG